MYDSNVCNGKLSLYDIHTYPDYKGIYKYDMRYMMKDTTPNWAKGVNGNPKTVPNNEYKGLHEGRSGIVQCIDKL